MASKDTAMSLSNSNVTSLRRSTGSGLAATAVNVEMERMMECPVCQEIPVPPIYTCETGHAICKDCKIKLKECALCKKPYTNSRSYPLESMVLAAKFYCSHRQKGCAVIASVEELSKHHKTCSFGPMPCHLGKLDDCKESTVYLENYAQHLQTVHFSPNLSPWGKGNSYVEAFPAPFGGITNTSNLEASWLDGLFHFDGQVFVRRAFIRRSKFYFGCYLIGNEAKARMYSVKITIQKLPGCQVPKYELTTLVPSILELCKNVDLQPYVAVTKELMEQLGYFIPAADGCCQLHCNVYYKILKL